MATLGAFHQTYYKKKAFDFAYKQFRKHFPESPYLILSDNGDDFSEYEDTKTKFIKSDIRNYGGGPKSIDLIKKENNYIWLDWYQRIKTACEFCDTDYIMMMEDDVYITSAFDITQDFEICGPKNCRLSDYTIDYIQNVTGKQISGYYGFSGGSIMNARTFLENYDRIIDNFEKMHAGYTNSRTDHTAAAGDANTTIQFLLLGKEYTFSPWLGNQILHPYKDLYTPEEMPSSRH
jgi:hypothetical protein